MDEKGLDDKLTSGWQLVPAEVFSVEPQSFTESTLYFIHLREYIEPMLSKCYPVQSWKG